MADYLRSLVETSRPARMVGLFTGHSLKAGDVERLAASCVKAMREEDAAADLTLKALPDGDRTYRVTVVGGAGATPHDVLVQVFEVRDPASPHRALLDHVGRKDAELSAAASHLQQNAVSYLQLASGTLDHPARVHPFENLVSLFTTALGAAIVDPAAAIVTSDPGEWADALEQSLEIEREIGSLRR